MSLESNDRHSSVVSGNVAITRLLRFGKAEISSTDEYAQCQMHMLVTAAGSATDGMTFDLSRMRSICIGLLPANV